MVDMGLPTQARRKRPLTDWEGDDHVPGSGGRYVSCVDTATGRALAWATNGRITYDGQRIRAAVRPPDVNGITFEQADQAIHSLCGRHLVRMTDPTKAKVNAWLRAGKGLVVAGKYADIPRAYRFQYGADFNHAIFLSRTNASGTIVREYDPLDPRVHQYGTLVPLSVLWPFIASLGYYVAYVPLEHL